MASKQDIEQGIAVNLAGTVPQGHALAPVRARLLKVARTPQWVIGTVVDDETRVKHPRDGGDVRTPTLMFVDLAGIVDPAECDQLAAMMARARAAATGQATLEESIAAPPADPAQPPEGGRPLPKEDAGNKTG